MIMMFPLKNHSNVKVVFSLAFFIYDLTPVSEDIQLID